MVLLADIKKIADRYDIEHRGLKRDELMEELQGLDEWPEIEEKLKVADDIRKHERKLASSVRITPLKPLLEPGTTISIVKDSASPGHQSTATVVWSYKRQMFVTVDGEDAAAGRVLKFEKHGSDWTCAEGWALGQATNEPAATEESAERSLPLGALTSDREEAWSGAQRRRGQTSPPAAQMPARLPLKFDDLEPPASPLRWSQELPGDDLDELLLAKLGLLMGPTET